MPILQSPDESAHADYAFTLYSTGRLVRAADLRPGTDVHPAVRYLENASGFRAMRYNPDGRVPADYGSPAFYRSVDLGAPRVSSDLLAENGGRIPFVAREYPYLYYALDAAAIELGATVSDGSLTFEFFAARGFGLVLLACSLLLSYATLRRLHFRAPAALGLTAAIGMFPLTSWMSAYVQPDNLAFTAVSLVFYLSVRLRREAPLCAAGLLGLSLWLLALTKPQYFVAAALPALADRTLRSAAQRLSTGQWFAYLALVLGPALIATASARAVSSGTAAQVAAFVSANGDPVGVALRGGLTHAVAYLADSTLQAWSSLFVAGVSFWTYWGAIGWTGTRLDFGSAALTEFVYAALGGLSLFVAMLVAMRLVFRVWPALARVGRRRGALGALRLLASDVLLNTLLLFIAIMLTVYVSTGGSMGNAGRYWLPVILPSVLCAARYGPRALPRRFGLPFARVLGGGLLVYSLAATFVGLATLQARFYEPPRTLGREELRARFERLGPYPVEALIDRRARTLPADASVVVAGYAVDSRSGLPAREVALLLDGRNIGKASYGSPRPEVVGKFHDDELLRTGFSGRLDLRGLAPGEHELRLAIGESTRSAPYPSTALVRFRVAHRP